MTYKKKLIEVALPLEALNQGSKPETENPFLRGHPRAIHNWWARTPLSVCRSILFAQLVDDPGNTLPPREAEAARRELLDIVAQLATWNGMQDRRVLEKARALVKQATAGKPFSLWDPFAGRGSIPLEGLRLGLDVVASDLNPVAVLINKALLGISLRFGRQAPINPSHTPALAGVDGAGIPEDLRFYGKWVATQAKERIGHLYPHVNIAAAKGGGDGTVIAWIWARTVRSPNPAWDAEVPLVRSWVLAKGKKGQESCWVEPVVDHASRSISYRIREGGEPPDATISRGAHGKCLATGSPIPPQWLQAEGAAGRLGVVLLAMVVVDAAGKRHYVSSTEPLPDLPMPSYVPREHLSDNRRWFSPPLYGMETFASLFTQRQLVALSTLSDIILETRETIKEHALAAGLPAGGGTFEQGGRGAAAYADALTILLACALSRLTDYSSSLASWNPTNENISHLFQRQAIPMVWDFAEANVLESKLSFAAVAGWVADAFSHAVTDVELSAFSAQRDARKWRPDSKASAFLVSTDPPYYDNIGYADISDFFYVWLRNIFKSTLPDLFSTLLTPKQDELIASSARHKGSASEAEQFFRQGLLQAFSRIRETASDEFPVTIYYAFKQSEGKSGDKATSTGWETMLTGLIDAGFQITATWPVRTTKKARSVARGTNALASAIVLACRPQSDAAPMATRNELLAALREELPAAVRVLQTAGVAPVDLAQAAIGPGMAVFSRFSKVVEADGSTMRIAPALGLINEVLEEVLSEEETEFDRDTRWALTWFEQHGMDWGPFGVAENLSKAKNTSVAGVVEAGVVESRLGKVRLLTREELDDGWDPGADKRLTVWEVTQYLVRELNEGEQDAANLLAIVGLGYGERTKQLAYLLHRISERKGWAKEALAYNGLIVAWPELARLAAGSVSEPEQQILPGS